MRLALALSVVFIAAGLAAGKAGHRAKSSYETAADELAGIILPMARNSARYFGVRDEIVGYLNGEISLESLQEELESLETELVSAKRSLRKYRAGKRMASDLESCGIDPEEVEMFADSAALELEEYIWSLESIGAYFSERREDESGISSQPSEADLWRDSFLVIEETYWGCQYYEGINYWFAGWDERQTDYVREQILEQMPDDRVTTPSAWETDPAIVQRKAELFRRGREEYYDIAYFGISSNDLDGKRREYEKEEPGVGRVFPPGSWLNSLKKLKLQKENEALLNDITEEFF